jgi:hypothetical protein
MPPPLKCPRLDPETIKQITIDVHSLGGGQ